MYESVYLVAIQTKDEEDPKVLLNLNLHQVNEIKQSYRRSIKDNVPFEFSHPETGGEALLNPDFVVGLIVREMI